MNSIVLALCFVGLAAAAPQQKPAREGRQFLLAQPQQYVAQPQQYVAQPQQYVVSQTTKAVSEAKNYVLDPRKPIAIIEMHSSNQEDGNFNYDFKAENGIVAETAGSIKVLDPKHQAQVMQGKYAYVAPDGTNIESTWYADETGFHIEGAHLPTPPPVPEAIARALEYIRSLPPSKEDMEQEKSS